MSASVPETTSNFATKSLQVSTQNCQKTIFMSDLLYDAVDCVVVKEEYNVVTDVVEETVVEIVVKDDVVTGVVEVEHKVK